MDLPAKIRDLLSTESLTNREIRSKLKETEGRDFSQREINKELYKMKNQKILKRTELNPPKWSPVEREVIDFRIFGSISNYFSSLF